MIKKINQFSSQVKRGIQINYKPVNSVFYVGPIRLIGLSLFLTKKPHFMYEKKGVHEKISTSF